MSENVLWQLVLTLGVIAELVVIGSAWKRSTRVAGAALAFTPALILYAVALLSQAERAVGNGWPLPATPTLIFAIFVFSPLGIGLGFIARMRLQSYLLWIGWAINWIPLAVIGFMVCCFKIEIW